MFEILFTYYIYFMAFIIIGGSFVKILDVIEWRKYRNEMRKEEERIRRKNQNLRKMVIALNKPVMSDRTKDIDRQTVIIKGVFANEA